MAYDTIKDKLSSISWNLKRIADSLDDLVELKSQEQEPINQIRHKYQTERLIKILKGKQESNTQSNPKISKGKPRGGWI